MIKNIFGIRRLLDNGLEQLVISDQDGNVLAESVAVESTEVCFVEYNGLQFLALPDRLLGEQGISISLASIKKFVS